MPTLRLRSRGSPAVEPACPWVIETAGPTKRYGAITAVEDLALRVPRGGVFGLLGPNGSGKTTTMGMLLSLVRPTAGTIRLFGLDEDRAREQALARVSAVVETPALYPYLSGRANLQYFQGISEKRDPGAVQRLLRLAGLEDRADGKFGTHSMGMKQRLGIASALLGDPELLVLDEPTNGLDPAGVAEIRELIRSLGRDGRTVILSSHLLHEVEQICDHIAILSRGRLIAQGPVVELLRSREKLRVRTTDDGKAVTVISSLAFSWWVQGTSASRSAPSPATVAQVQVLIRPNDPVYELGFRLFGSRQEDVFWRRTLETLATHFGVNSTADMVARCVDQKLQWSRLGNIRHNAAVHTVLHALTAPLRWPRLLVRR